VKRTSIVKLLLVTAVVAGAFAVGSSVASAAVTICTGGACPATTTHNVKPSNQSGNVQCPEGTTQVAFAATDIATGSASEPYSFGGLSGTVSLTYNTSTGAVSFSVSGGAVVNEFHLHGGAGQGGSQSTNIYSYHAPTFPAGGVTSDAGLFYPGPQSGAFACLISPLVLAVSTHSFQASRVGRAVTLRWSTASEANVLGFNVYRKSNGTLVRLNKRMVPATSLSKTAGAHAYSFRAMLRSRRLAASSRYVLAEVHGNGSRTLYGPVRASAAS